VSGIAKLPCTVGVAMTLACFVGACGSGGESGSAKSGAATGSSLKHLTTCGDFTDPPFNFIQGSQQKGFDPDFLRAATSAMGTSLQMKDTRFSSLIAGLAAGRCDAVVSFMYVTPERAKTVDFVPYAESGIGFLVKQNGQFKPQQLTDLCGRSVSTLQGGVEDALALPTGELGKKCAAQSKPIKVKSLPTGTAAVQELISGRVDAFFMDNAGAVAFAKQYAKNGLAVSNHELLSPVVGGIAVRKNDPVRKRWFTEAIAKLQDSGELDKLYKTYGLGPVTHADFEAALKGKPVGKTSA
jgi:polar amino acid transport system substrate-binding protein